MSALATRLSALRAQAGAVGAETLEPAFVAATDASISPIPEQLRRLLGIRVRTQAKLLALDRSLPGSEIADGLRLVERDYPWHEMPQELNAHFAGLGRIAREHLIYFDTETTGLSGGTGTRAFMIGAAHWHESGLRVRQLLTTTMSGEAAMLREFSGWLNPQTTLVSYNGKSYDAPLLATRYRLHRMINPLMDLPHLDLLYPVRRRFRGVWENCRLSTVEREWLAVVRDDETGQEVEPMRDDGARQHGGSRFPAHTDLRATGWWVPSGLESTMIEYYRAMDRSRARRDPMIRARICPQARSFERLMYGTPDDHPSLRQLVAEAEHLDERRVERGREIRRSWAA